MDTDLFGVWLVEMSYGRIGRTGRSKIRSFTTIMIGWPGKKRAYAFERFTDPRTYTLSAEEMAAALELLERIWYHRDLDAAVAADGGDQADIDPPAVQPPGTSLVKSAGMFASGRPARILPHPAKTHRRSRRFR